MDEPIPQGATVGEPIPQGAQVGAPQNAAPTTEPIPQGAEIGAAAPIPATPKGNGVFGDADTNSALGNVVAGFSKEANKTAVGTIDLLNKANRFLGNKNDDIPQLPVAQDDLETHGTGQKIGGLAENGAEFLTGDAALDAGLAKAMSLVKASKLSPLLTETLKIAKAHPLISRIIEGGAKAAAVGGAQGGAKGAAEGNAAGGAEGGAIGGAVGGAAGEALVEAATPLARAIGEKLGIGTTAVKDAQEALRPSKSNRDFAVKFERAAPYLDDINKSTPPATMEDWANNADAARENLYQQKIQPLIAQHENYPLSNSNIASRINAAIDPVMASQDPQEASLIHAQAVKLLNTSDPIRMGDAEQILQYYNKKVAATGYWSKPPAERVALMQTDGKIAGLVATADAIRDEFYSNLEQIHPGADIRNLKADYGALAETGNTIRGRINVDARQSRISLKEMLGLLTGAHLGGPAGVAAAAVPFIDRAVNSPSKMLGRAVSKAANPGESAVGRAATGAAKVAGKAIKSGAPFAGAQAGQAIANSGRVIFQDSSGAVHSVPAEHIGEAKRVDPNLKIISGQN